MNNTTVKLINYNELTPNNNKTLSFDTLQDQINFFSGLADYTYLPIDTEFRKVKENETIKIKISYDNALKYNYLMYKNDTKWFFAYIIDIQYINENITMFTLDTDVLQTYMFDYEIGESFIDRQHETRFISDGNGGYYTRWNTIDEQLDYGKEYTIRSEKIEDENAPEYTNGTKHNLVWVYIYAKEALCSGTPPKAKYYGVNSNLIVYVSPLLLLDGATIGAPVYKVGNTLDGFYDNFSTADIAEMSENPNVISIAFSRMPPSSYQFTEDPSETFNFTITPFADFPLCDAIPNVNGRGFVIGNIETDINIKTVDKTNFNVSSLSINNGKSRFTEPKLYTFPYKFNKLNAYGNSMIIKNEYVDDVSNHNLDVSIMGSKLLSLTFDEVFKLNNYLGGQGFVDSNDKHNIITNVNNQLNLRTDAWNEYVSRNKASMNAGIITAGAQVGLATVGAVLAPATGGISLALAGVALSGASQIGGQLAKRSDIKNTPDEIKDGAGDIMVNKSIHKLYFTFDTYEITSEYANRLANYFYYYGYKSSRYETPNLRSRYYFNYIKTMDTRVISDLPLRIVDKIKQHYENGLTIYHVRDITNFEIETQKENLEMTLV